jgi:hypothetical protein
MEEGGEARRDSDPPRAAEKGGEGGGGEGEGRRAEEREKVGSTGEHALRREYSSNGNWTEAEHCSRHTTGRSRERLRKVRLRHALEWGAAENRTRSLSVCWTERLGQITLTGSGIIGWMYENNQQVQGAGSQMIAFARLNGTVLFTISETALRCK